VVIDTKYKLLSEAKNYDNVSQSDVYQMYAYGAKTNADTIMLLYPDDGNSTYLNWKMIYDHDHQIPLLIRSVTLSIDLMKDLNMFIDQLAHYFGELCPQPHINPIPMN
jgi:5-methylcytosine-specific restriction enzyme subunit McrC